MQTQYIIFSRDVIWSQHSMEEKKDFSYYEVKKKMSVDLGTVVDTRKFQNTHKSAL